MQIEYRKAVIEDGEQLLAWRNDPGTFRYSHNSNPVSREEHYTWLNSVLGSTDRTIYIAEISGRPVGMLRIDRDSSSQVGELSWVVAPEMRGHGIGQAMLKKARVMLSGVLVAEIYAQNIASIAIAEAAGFFFTKEEGGVLHYRSVS